MIVLGARFGSHGLGRSNGAGSDEIGAVVRELVGARARLAARPGARTRTVRVAAR